VKVCIKNFVQALKRSRANWEQQTFGEKLIQEDRPRIAGDWLMITDQMKRVESNRYSVTMTRDSCDISQVLHY